MTVLLVLLALVAAWQAPAAVLTGVVVDNRTGRPLARTQVRIESTAGSAESVGRSLFADQAGEFRFEALPGGVYLLRAERRGYAPARFGARRWNGPGTPIVLSGEAQFGAELRLKKWGVIAGEVHDENRVGLVGFHVYAYRAGTRLKFAASGESDDRGWYRIPGLEPGKYYVRTEPRELEDHHGLMPTFFGRTTRAADATPVEVKLDEEATGVNLEPLPGRLCTLAGTLSGPVAADVSLYTDAGLRTARVDPGGTFLFDQLAPGSYELLAASAGGARPLASYMRIELSQGRQDVNVQLAPAPSVRVNCEVRGPTSADQSSISIFLRRREPVDESPRRLVCGESSPLSPGRWEVAAAPPPDLYVASVFNARSGDTAYEFSLDSSEGRDITLVFRSRPASLAGRVWIEEGQPAAGAPVYICPLDPEVRSRLGGVRSTRSDQNGEFRFSGLAPGKYEVLSSFAMEEAESAAWPPGEGQPVELEAGAEASVSVRLGHHP